ncbi:hypothetical protein TSUD_144830 [Trifolium subterraneum]|uniref:Uncharacterized protein n=1 Tax=Trifolium subterraneum TaxID=3900 RepID=A0A2Z6N8T6_TRISU|nr:hypothetical protein TSUD_144830 [Trifolium subterraneum]
MRIENERDEWCDGTLLARVALQSSACYVVETGKGELLKSVEMREKHQYGYPYQHCTNYANC